MLLIGGNFPTNRFANINLPLQKVMSKEKLIGVIFLKKQFSERLPGMFKYLMEPRPVLFSGTVLEQPVRSPGCYLLILLPPPW